MTDAGEQAHLSNGESAYPRRWDRSWSSSEGAPLPQGATWIAEEQAYNFALYSKHAGSVEVLLYRPTDLVRPHLVYRLDPRRHKSGRIWHCRLAGSVTEDAMYYGFRVHGPPPDERTDWDRFDDGKILLDPYAREVFFPPAFDRAAAMAPGPNPGRAPLAVLPRRSDAFDWTGDRRLRHEADAIIYELHVRGFTAHESAAVPDPRRGRYLGVIDRIPHLQELGVTVVELMPVFQTDPRSGDYWGYMPLGFFAPHAGYASSANGWRAHDELRTLVRALHAAGIEVVLDVVYNHTAEGDHRGPTYSHKGIDNSTYYMMTADPERPYANYSGTGNTLHTSNYYVRKMILDSLRYWAEEMHVDGFRFDLASVFTRRGDGSIDLERPGIFAEIAADPLLSGLRLIAEPWDMEAYHLGRSLPGASWAQWNGRFSEDVRRFVRGEPGLTGLLAQRLYGSDDLFPDDRANAYRPVQSINYVTAHDGFTLYDLVSYDRKRNWANGEQNRDGADENFSWNCGWEGDADAPPEVLALRRRQAKNFLCLLLLANGTPMLRGGDEFLQTQGGNNNAYNQDNPTTWLDWTRLAANAEVFDFTRRMIAFRKAHPTLCRSRFWRGDVSWYGPGAGDDPFAGGHCLAFHLSGASEADADLYVMINGGPADRSFEVQASAPRWTGGIDTSRIDPFQPAEEPDPPGLRHAVRLVPARSIQVLVSDVPPGDPAGAAAR
jgi:isoamylase